MKLCKDTKLNVVHHMNLQKNYSQNCSFSYCGLINDWIGTVIYTWYFYEGHANEVTCGTCKILVQNIIVRKLKNEAY